MVDNEKNLSDEYQIRLEKLKKIMALGQNPYPEKFEKLHHTADVLKLPADSKVKTAGRILTIREMGKIIFCHILDDTGRLQIVLREDELSQKKNKEFLKFFDPGDFIGLEGTVFTTRRGELSVLVTSYQLLGKALRPLPEKWHGLKNQELLYRQRYLDLISNPETFKRFMFRSQFIKLLREFYWSKNFVEVETPILTNTASGAIAKPFKTHHNAYDTDVYLRIAPETFLKECIIGGFEKVFEIGRLFRNEGIDPSHLQDFTTVEHYVAYWNYEDNIRFTEELMTDLLKKLFGRLDVPIKNRKGETITINFKTPWARTNFTEIIKKDCGIDVSKFSGPEKLRKEIKAKKIKIDEIERLGLGNVIDALYKTVSRDKIINPTFITHHPIELSPLARRNDTNPNIADRFQVVVNGWEIVNAYSELVDPLDQKQRFDDQAKLQASGDHEAHGKDDEFVKALEYGAPPISGWSIGIDRIVTLLTQQDNLRDVVLFPLLRPEK